MFGNALVPGMLSSTQRFRLPLWLFIGALSAATPTNAEPSADRSYSVASITAIEAYIRARYSYEEKAEAYWQSIADKRRTRIAKRRTGETISLNDYVLTHPPSYAGPPRPPGYMPPRRDPDLRIERIPVVADFLRAAAEQFNFMPDRPRTEAEFMRAYAKAAIAAGLTREQAVRIYAFETGGNGSHDSQAGLISARKDARPISAALGYNQLLSTNTVGLLAGHGEKLVAVLSEIATRLGSSEKTNSERKVSALKRMIAFSRSVPYAWSEHEKLAKTTQGGKGIHAAVLDRDLGPLLQTQKLLDSVSYARTQGLSRPLTAAELELMNFTGDGNGFDMITMPPVLRAQVPTSNFFQRKGYERNPIAQRTATVEALIEAINAKMDRASQAPGAKALAIAF